MYYHDQVNESNKVQLR